MLTISDPARSTRNNLPLLVLCSSVLRWEMVMMRTLWDREEPAFMPVADSSRFSAPAAITSIISSALDT